MGTESNCPSLSFLMMLTTFFWLVNFFVAHRWTITSFRRLLHGLWRDLQVIDERIEELDREIEQISARIACQGPAPDAVAGAAASDRIYVGSLTA
jgi:hypothetical protein